MSEYLKKIRFDRIVLTFPDLEKILGFPLKPASKKYVGFWANADSHPMSASWKSAGFLTGKIHLGVDVEFIRGTERPRIKKKEVPAVPKKTEETKIDDYGWLKTDDDPPAKDGKITPADTKKAAESRKLKK